MNAPVSHQLTPMRQLAVHAAHQTLAAANELLRYAIEGPTDRRPPFGDAQVAELLADALRQGLEIEHAEISEEGIGYGHPDDAGHRNTLLIAVTRFLNGWVG